jgi:hypothetical protein
MKVAYYVTLVGAMLWTLFNLSMTGAFQCIATPLGMSLIGWIPFYLVRRALKTQEENQCRIRKAVALEAVRQHNQGNE